MSDADEVKARLNIADIIGEKVHLKKAGRNFKGLCPFHNEKTPSFMVSPDRQTFKCFGCGKGGSVIDFVMEYDRMDFGEALEALAERAGVTLTSRPPDSRESKLKKEIYEVNEAASQYYQYLLASHPLGEHARQYLKNRGVTDKISKTFGIGYSPKSWESLRNYLKKKKYSDELLETAGLVLRSARGGYDRFRGRVMFTLRDHKGNAVGFSGRVLEKDAREAKYINTSETPVYSKSHVLFGLNVTKEAILKAREVILMEGEFDVISSFAAGITNVAAIKGSALTEGHVGLLKRFADKILLSLDADLAGDAAARRGIEIAEKAGFEIKVVETPSGKDPDEAVREDAAGFKKAVAKAIPIYDYYLHSAVRRYDAKTISGKRAITEELFPILSTIDNPVIQAHYVKKLAGALDTSEEAVGDGVKKAARAPKDLRRVVERVSAPEKKEELGREEKLEHYFLALLLQGKTAEFFEDVKDELPVSDFTHPGVYRIMTALGAMISPNQPFVLKDFSEALPKELLPVLDTAALWDLSGVVDDEEILHREWHKAVRELRRSILRKKIKNLSLVMEAGGEEADPSGFRKMQEALAGLTNDLRALEKSQVN